MTRPGSMTILGGGVAGLAAGHHARRLEMAPLILEAGDAWGGNCRTLARDGYRFDTGAHRFHDQAPEATREVRELVGASLRVVRAPEAIQNAAARLRGSGRWW